DSILSLYETFRPDLVRARTAQRALYQSSIDLWRLRSPPGSSLGPAAHAAGGALVLQRLRPARPPPRMPPPHALQGGGTLPLLRQTQARNVVEISPRGGWSTSWILEALNANGSGHLYSYDLVDDATRIVPRAVAGDRWTFVHGDVRRCVESLPERIDYLFLDS